MKVTFYTFVPIADEHRDGLPRLVRESDGHLTAAIWTDGAWRYATDPRFGQHPLTHEPIEVAI